MCARTCGGRGVSPVPCDSAGIYRADRQCLSTLLKLARSSVPSSRTTQKRGQDEAINVAGELAQVAAVLILQGSASASIHNIAVSARLRVQGTCRYDSASLLLALLCRLRARTGIVVVDGVVQETGFYGPGCDSQELYVKPLARLQVASLL